MGMQGNKTVEPPSPRKLLAAFSGGSIVFWILAAMLIHAVLIGGLSVGYIRDRWIDPEGARIRKEEAEKEAKLIKELENAKRQRLARIAATNAFLAAQALSNATLRASGTNTSANVNVSTNTASDTGDIPPERANTRIVRSITEKASTNELPKESDLGISIDETNPKK
ncbi:MAG: hypothetical protein H7831_16740 [Magnetococcus sp. WYHC-3]